MLQLIANSVDKGNIMAKDGFAFQELHKRRVCQVAANKPNTRRTHRDWAAASSQDPTVRGPRGIIDSTSPCANGMTPSKLYGVYINEEL